MVNKLFFILLTSILFSSCIRGYLYTNTVTPYCTDMGGVVTEQESGFSGQKQINIPRVPGARTIWSSNAIYDAAKAKGLKIVEYCDRKQFSILNGLYGTDEIIVYGR